MDPQVSDRKTEKKITMSVYYISGKSGMSGMLCMVSSTHPLRSHVEQYCRRWNVNDFEDSGFHFLAHKAAPSPGADRAVIPSHSPPPSLSQLTNSTAITSQSLSGRMSNLNITVQRSASATSIVPYHCH